MWVRTGVRPGAAVLTEPFRRGTGRTHADHAGVGLGLGLAIVKTTTQAHEGALTRAPRPAGDLRITVELPAPQGQMLCIMLTAVRN
ncbi:ATP-binding protein [Streptomyces fuscichromogenes]|uniref:ATP-binding protein n=1 Tax=Streptomyces fuscichromogenes TaxID=1324013 RepID=UPI00380803CA